MSYLDPPRLYFAGTFSATISTVNNDPAHFDNARFEPDFQLPTKGNAWNGWFNPRGDGDWRLMGCKVTGAVGADGTPVTGDPVLSCLLGDSDRLPPAKLVDLDSMQQLVSEIWGLELRVCDADGHNSVRGTFEHASFMDIWTRAIGDSDGGDNSAAAMWQSVLYDLEWGDVTASPFLTALQHAAKRSGRLSVKFNTDGLNLNATDPDFMRGRIVGTLGAALPNEPKHFVRGRQLMAVSSGAQGFPVPAGGLNTCVAKLDAKAAALHLDLGNALPTVTAGGALADLGALEVQYTTPQNVNVAIGTVDYTADGWYEACAGVVSLPVPAAAVQTIAGSQLSILKPEAAGQAIAIAEPASGLHCRADDFVFRLDSGDTATVRVWASRFGQPYPGAQITVIHDSNQLQAAPFGNAPPPGLPPEAVDFPPAIVANANGIATLSIFARAPGNPRRFIDGQVYGIRPMLTETVAPGAAYSFNLWEFVSVLAFDPFAADEPPTWEGCIHPIFQQYANLYPLMADIVDLGDYDSVCGMREMLVMAFSLPISDPNAMPVTRDLSRARRTAILRWLRTLDPEGKPLRGALQPTSATQPAHALLPLTLPEDGDGAPHPEKGGKAVALTRRLAFNPEARSAR